MVTISPIKAVINMRKSINNFFLFFSLMVLFSGCSFPRPVLKLDPVAEQIDWWYGNQRINLTSPEGLGLELTYLGSQDYRMEFVVEVANQTGESIMVEPSAFRLVPLGKPGANETQQAVDPERELLEAELLSAQERSDQRNEAVIRLIDATADLASSDSASDPNRAENEDWTEEELRNNRRLNSLSDRREYWANQALRKTNLPDGYKMSGTIQFNRIDNAPAIRIECTLNGQDFAVRYDQRLVRPADLRE